jgi:nucleoside-diphosphate-sugar epimerase
VTVIKAPLGSTEGITADTIQSWLGGVGVTFEYVYDNNSKNVDEGTAGKALCDAVKNWGTCKLYTYVSSAGIYQPPADAVFPMSEDTTPIKATAGQVQFDTYAAKDLGLPLVSFRPQYIYGEKANKYDYIDWYFDRLVRKLPLPIPKPGTQMVSLTNSVDVATLLASPVMNGKEDEAIEQRFFNCGTDKLYTYDEVAYMCADAAGIPQEDVTIEHYDPDLFGKANFPFRMTDFYVAPDMAKQKLSYGGAENDLKTDLKWYYEGYLARGGPTKEIDLIKDWEIVVVSKTTFQMGSVYDKYISIPLDVSNVKELKENY